jgi:sodium-dependent dicarboxylate transporter 2/3/5
VRREKEKLGKWKPGEKNAVFAFTITVVLWIIPGILALIYGSEAPISKAYGTCVAALIGAGLLFLLPVNWKEREFTIIMETGDEN